MAYLADFSIATLLITFVGCGLGTLMIKTDLRLARDKGDVVVVA